MMTWAVSFGGRRCRGYVDMIHAMRAFQQAEPGARLWKKCEDGWLIVAVMTVPTPKRRWYQRFMNRETLVGEG